MEQNTLNHRIRKNHEFRPLIQRILGILLIATAAIMSGACANMSTIELTADPMVIRRHDSTTISWTAGEYATYEQFAVRLGEQTELLNGKRKFAPMSDTTFVAKLIDAIDPDLADWLDQISVDVKVIEPIYYSAEEERRLLDTLGRLNDVFAILDFIHGHQSSKAADVARCKMWKIQFLTAWSAGTEAFRQFAEKNPDNPFAEDAMQMLAEGRYDMESGGGSYSGTGGYGDSRGYDDYGSTGDYPDRGGYDGTGGYDRYGGYDGSLDHPGYGGYRGSPGYRGGGMYEGGHPHDRWTGDVRKGDVLLNLRGADCAEGRVGELFFDMRDSRTGRSLRPTYMHQLEVLENGRPVEIISVDRICGEVRAAVDFVFMIDGTSSMQPYISALKNDIHFFARHLSYSGVDYRLGLVVYGDEVRKCQGMTSDVFLFSEWLSAVYAHGGGDPDENALEAMAAGFDLPLRPNASRHFVVLTDAGFHDARNARSSMGWTRFTAESMVDLLNLENVTLSVVGPTNQMSHSSSSSSMEFDYKSIMLSCMEGRGLDVRAMMHSRYSTWRSTTTLSTTTYSATAYSTLTNGTGGYFFLIPSSGERVDLREIFSQFHGKLTQNLYRLCYRRRQDCHSYSPTDLLLRVCSPYSGILAQDTWYCNRSAPCSNSYPKPCWKRYSHPCQHPCPRSRSYDPCPEPRTGPRPRSYYDPCPEPHTGPRLKYYHDPCPQPHSDPCLKPYSKPFLNSYPKPGPDPCSKPYSEPHSKRYLHPCSESNTRRNSEPCPKTCSKSFSNIYFPVGKSGLDDVLNPGELRDFADMLRERPDLCISLEGYTSDVHSPEHNFNLSWDRLTTVEQYLKAFCHPSQLHIATGFGDHKYVQELNPYAGESRHDRANDWSRRMNCCVRIGVIENRYDPDAYPQIDRPKGKFRYTIKLLNPWYEYDERGMRLRFDAFKNLESSYAGRQFYDDGVPCYGGFYRASDAYGFIENVLQDLNREEFCHSHLIVSRIQP